MSKKQESANRLRYIRALERFSGGIVNYLFKADDITKEGFEKKVKNAKKLLDRVEKVVLYKGELQDLEKLVTKIQSYVGSQTDIDDIKKDILYSSNQLEKSKNFKKYKKPKYSKNSQEDW